MAMSDKKTVKAARDALRHRWRKHRNKEAVLTSSEVWDLAVRHIKLKTEEKKHDET